ncbi:MAG: hypothetical protein WBV28_10485 [Terracidiphilus sp.]
MNLDAQANGNDQVAVVASYVTATLWKRLRLLAVPLAGFPIWLAGCGGSAVTANPSNDVFAIAPFTTQVDTNCTGCNATNARGSAVHQFTATLNSGKSADVEWSVSGGDRSAGAGIITANGQYSPPSFLTTDRVEVVVTATLKANPGMRATSVITVTPGFLQPLTPENVALGANQTIVVTGVLAEAGGGVDIRFGLSDSPTGTSGGEGSLSATTCQRTERAFSTCTVTYTAPTVVQSTFVTYVVATAGDSPSKTQAAVLLNSAGVSSNPTGHQEQLATPMLLGSSGGNNNDFDAHGNNIVDCCSGTLGSLVQDNTGRQFLLSNNHVLAQSDHANVGDAIVQPGLIDNNCTPYGEGAGTLPVGALTAWLPLSSKETNADAAIAEVGSHTVDATGSILELGVRRSDGSLAAAPPGTSSTDGRGEIASLQMRVAKSGRTTGLTCGGVSALDVDISVDYFRDCAETRPYLTKTFTNQVGLSGDHLSDAGDSGALVVDAGNAEPVGLYFAGGTDAAGVGQGMANPANDVLNELSAQNPRGNFNFVGGPDHAVSCLSYGDSSVAAAQSLALTDAENARAQRALTTARSLVNPATGVLGVAMGKSTDHPGEAAVVMYVAGNAGSSVPSIIDGVRTVVIPSTARAVAEGAAPATVSISDAPPLMNETIQQAVIVKQQVARELMNQNPAFFGIGVGLSLDNPRDAALVIYVDRKDIPAQLPQTIQGLRTRYIVMDRMHVTRSYAATFATGKHCTAHPVSEQTKEYDPASALQPHSLGLF